MTTVTLNGLATRKLRALLTAIAIVLGVAMISGTFVLMDTTMHAFNNVFTTAYSKADAVVLGKSPMSGNNAHSSNVPPVPASLVARIRTLPRVSAAQGFIDDKAEIRNATGAAITGPGTPQAFGIPSRGSAFDFLSVVAGHRPSGPRQIALDEQTAKTNHFSLGSTAGIVSRYPLEWFRVVGLVRFGGMSSLGPIQILVFDTATAQRLFDKQGLYDEIFVSAHGASPAQLVRTLAPRLPASAEVETGATRARSYTNNVNTQFALFRYVLLAFGVIALFVGSFVIFNTLSVTVAQRSRELATLRTLGASRRQVLASVVVEGLVIGVVASVIGLAAGLGLAKALEAMLASSGMQLPDAGTVFSTRTMIVSLAAGIAVTLLASLAPALRATRVAPIAAIREGAQLPPGRLARARTPVLAVVGLLGASILATGLFASGLGTSNRLVLLACGAAFLFVGVAFAARWLIRPLSNLVGRPLEAISGTPGMLARENTARNPARTAITAGALTVGLALVAFVATLGAGLRGSVNGTLRQEIHATYVISADNGAPISPSVAAALRTGSGVTATSVRSGQISTFDATEQITGIDPATFAPSYRFKWVAGSNAGALPALGDNGAIISSDFATAHHLRVGSRLPAQTQSGVKLDLTVRAIQKLPTFGPLLGAVTISTTLFDHSFLQPGDKVVLADTGGANAGAQRWLTGLLAGFPTAKVQTVDGYIKTSQATINTLLNLFYVLLALSVIISLFGILNTLALSIVERTREIGALRAIGMTRRQLRRMITVESEIIAMIGAVLGIIVGLALAALATAALSSWSLTFTVPVPTLVALAVAAFFAGIAAGILPARRAAHLDPLHALQYE